VTSRQEPGVAPSLAEDWPCHPGAVHVARCLLTELASVPVERITPAQACDGLVAQVYDRVAVVVEQWSGRPGSRPQGLHLSENQVRRAWPSACRKLVEAMASGDGRFTFWLLLAATRDQLVRDAATWPTWLSWLSGRAASQEPSVLQARVVDSHFTRHPEDLARNLVGMHFRSRAWEEVEALTRQVSGMTAYGTGKGAHGWRRARSGWAPVVGIARKEGERVWQRA
jgi:hypothetical protein